MTTAATFVTRALRRLQAIDITEQPSAAEMSHAMDILEEMLNGFTAGGINTDTQQLTCDVTSGEDWIRLPRVGNIVQDTSGLLVGLNVVGTGIPTDTRIKAVATDLVFQLSQAASASAGSTILTFSFLPSPIAYDAAIVALLAVRLSEDLGIAASAKLVVDANDGWNAILAGYIPDRKSVFDRAIAAPAGIWDPTTDLVT